MTVELLAPGAPQLEARLEEVDEPLCVTQLGRGHPVELAAPERLRGTVRVGRRDVPVNVGLVDRFVAAGQRHRDAVDRAAVGLVATVLTGFGARPHSLFVRYLVTGPVDRRAVARQPRTALAPPAIEDAVVDLAIVATADEDGRAGGPDRVALAQLDEGQGAGVVDGSGEVDRQTGRPERPPEPDRLGQQPPSVDLAA